MVTRPKARPIDVSPMAEADDQEHVKNKSTRTRPQARPFIDVSPRAERNEGETAQRFYEGGQIEGRGMKAAQMSGRKGCKTY